MWRGRTFVVKVKLVLQATVSHYYMISLANLDLDLIFGP